MPVHYTPYFQLHGGLYRHQATQSFNALLLILSQTRTITTSERNWSMNECIHSRNKNRLEQDRLTDLTFVHCNHAPSTEVIPLICLLLKFVSHVLCIQENSFDFPLNSGTCQAISGIRMIIRGEHDPLSLEGRNFSIGEWIEHPGVLEGEDTSRMNVALPSAVDDNSTGADDGGTEDERLRVCFVQITKSCVSSHRLDESWMHQ